MKKTTFLILPMILLMTGCSTPKETEETTVETKQTEVVTDETTEETEEMSQKDKEDIVLMYLQSSVEPFNFSFDSSQNVFNAEAVDKSVLLALVNIETDETVAEAWESITESFLIISESIYENIGAGYTINLVNPYAEDKTLLMVKDGQEIYNFTDDL